MFIFNKRVILMKSSGIDEAGRGPVLGPMVIVGILIDTSKLETLKFFKVRDSKMISRNVRTRLMKVINEIIDAKEIIEVWPSEIDEKNKQGISLNVLERIKMADIILKLKPERVFVDCPDIKPERFKKLLLKDVNFCCPIIAEHNADKKYIEVSAASIIAKVHRDEIINRLREKYGDFGSGYPSDSKTINFLKKWYKEHQSWPSIVRKSWKTLERIIKEV